MSSAKRCASTAPRSQPTSSRVWIISRNPSQAKLGAASAPLALAGALDGARAGETILVAGLGAGATAILFTVSKGLAPLRRKGVKLTDAIAGGRAVDYVSYLKNRHVLSSRTGGRG